MEIAIEYAALAIGAVLLVLIALVSAGVWSSRKRGDTHDRFVAGTYDGHHGDHGHDAGGHDGGGGGGDGGGGSH